MIEALIRAAPGTGTSTAPSTGTNTGPHVGMDRHVDPAARRSRRMWVRAGLGLAALAAAVALYSSLPGSDALAVDSADLRFGAVRRAPFRDYVPLRGEVAPLRTVLVAAVSGGQVARLIAGDGGMVAAGALLARLANPSLELEVASRSADIAGQLSAISGQRLTVQRDRLDGARDLAEATNALGKAEAELRKSRTLLDKGFVTDAAVAPLVREVGYQRGRVASLSGGGIAERAMLADQAAGIAETQGQLRASLAMVRRSLEALTLRAPVGGRLTAFALQPGQTVKAGDPVGQIDSEGAWKLIADVDQFYLGRVRDGQRAIADIDGAAVPMRVFKVLRQVEDGRFRVELGFAGRTPAALNRGQVMDVRLILGADRPAIVAPAGGWLDANGTLAFVVDGDGDGDGRFAVRRAIATGRRNPDQVEITAGLAPGERIVTTPIRPYAAYHTLVIRQGAAR